MTVAIDYFLSPQSPWTYLGHERFAEIAREAGATINVLPVDLGRVFPVSGGLPLAKRAPQRQAYRLVELKRFSEHLGRPLNLHPRYFPVASDDAAKLIIAVDANDGSDAAMKIAAAILRGVWVEEKNIADPHGAAGDARRDRPAGAATRRFAIAGRARALRGRTRSARSTAACSARRPMSSAARCSGARTGSTSSSGAWPGAEPLYILYLALAWATQALFASPVIASHFSAATL